MKTTTMITPDAGKMLFNGEVYASSVFLGALDSADNWREVPREEYEEWQREQERLLAESHDENADIEDVEASEVEPLNEASDETI